MVLTSLLCVPRRALPRQRRAHSQIPRLPHRHGGPPHPRPRRHRRYRGRARAGRVQAARRERAGALAGEHGHLFCTAFLLLNNASLHVASDEKLCVSSHWAAPLTQRMVPLDAGWLPPRLAGCDRLPFAGQRLLGPPDGAGDEGALRWLGYGGVCGRRDREAVSEVTEAG